MQTYGFVIAIIVGIGGLVVGGVGIAGYFHVGALSDVAQVDAIAMMAAGGGSSCLVLFVVGIVSTAQSYQEKSVIEIGGSRHIDTPSNLVYGPEAWSELGRKWDCELTILDADIPPVPVKEVAEGKIRIYIPQKISIQGSPKDLTLKTLLETRGILFEYCHEKIIDQFGNDTASGWVDIDRYISPESLLQNYEAQKKMVGGKGCHIPSLLIAVVRFAFIGKQSQDKELLLGTRCLEIIKENIENFLEEYPVVVKDASSDRLYIDYFDGARYSDIGVTAVSNS